MPAAHRLRCLCSMASLEAFLAPPAAVRGMRMLDRAAFRREVCLPVVRVPPPLCSEFLRRFKRAVLTYPGVKRIMDAKDRDGKASKAILLSPSECQEQPLSDEEREWIVANGGERDTHSLVLEYTHFTKQAVLRAVLPLEVKEVPSAFETVGHIAHLNLRDEQLPFKEVIGQVILDKQSNIRTVVNKTASIDETFRFFKMELLAGEDNMIATVKENGCTFKFDFSKVYWNSRLKTEHGRVVKLLNRGDVVLDAFAGVGPFALPACKRGCLVHANDLNPHSYAALLDSAGLSRVADSLHAYNMDARLFIRTVTAELLANFLQSRTDSSQLKNQKPNSSQLAKIKQTVVSHVIMNLPASACHFLDAFRGVYSCLPPSLREDVHLPTVHCYCFSKSAQPEEDAVCLVQQGLGAALEGGLGGDRVAVSRVRDVAPSKLILRVSFELPAAVAYAEASTQERPGLGENYRNCYSCSF